MSEKKKSKAKGRTKGTKVESYTFRTSWTADANGMAALRTAQATLGASGVKVTQKRIIDLCAQAYFAKLSPQQMTKIVTPLIAAEKAAVLAARRDKDVAALEERRRKLDEDLAALLGILSPEK
jgi:ABC-type siderophore export system fused ATPase/permease subunit